MLQELAQESNTDVRSQNVHSINIYVQEMIEYVDDIETMREVTINICMCDIGMKFGTWRIFNQKLVFAGSLALL